MATQLLPVRKETPSSLPTLTPPSRAGEVLPIDTQSVKSTSAVQSLTTLASTQQANGELAAAPSEDVEMEDRSAADEAEGLDEEVDDDEEGDEDGQAEGENDSDGSETEDEDDDDEESSGDESEDLEGSPVNTSLYSR